VSDEEVKRALAQRTENFLKLFQGGDYAQALLAARVITEDFPESAFGWKALGAILKLMGALDASLEPMRRATELDPCDAEAFSNLGTTLHDMGQLEPAVECYKKAIALNPQHAEAYCNLGVALKDAARFTEAQTCYLKALELKEGYPEAWSNLGNTLQILGDVPNAVSCYERAIALKPTFLEARSNLLFCLNYVHGLTGATMLAYAQQYGALVSERSQPKFNQWNTRPVGKPLRLGFVSGDFKNHPVGFFFEGLMTHLCHAEFVLHAFSTSFEADELTDRIKPLFDSWTLIVGLSDQEAASLIHKKGIDILVDLSGHTDHNRLAVFSFRPAPIQVSWLGYFAPTGLPEMDFFIGDPFLAPENEQLHFTEKLWQLPQTWFSRLPFSVSPSIQSLPALRNGWLTFGCLGNLAKMNDAVVALWARVLHAVPASRLLLKARQLADAAAVTKVQAGFQACGIDPQRLILQGPSLQQEYLQTYNQIDVVLDTFPYPGGTTSVDALWMGVPVLTLKGDRFLSRLGASVASNAGLSEWIAQDPDDYLTKAVAFTRNLEALERLRSGLRLRVSQGPLFNVKVFAENFADALRKMSEGGQVRP